MKSQSFIPPSRTLMGPGPSDVSPRVLEAMARPTIGHLDPVFIKMMDEVKSLIQYAFQTTNELTYAISAPGMAGMECCFANLVEENDKVIICKNGFFGERMKENVERYGGIPIMVEDEWGAKIDINKVEETLKLNQDAKIVAFVPDTHPQFDLVVKKQLSEHIIRDLQHHERIISLFETIFNGPVFPLPRVIPRTLFPNQNEHTTPPHQDYPHVQGSFETYAVWIPLCYCSKKLVVFL